MLKTSDIQDIAKAVSTMDNPDEIAAMLNDKLSEYMDEGSDLSPGEEKEGDPAAPEAMGGDEEESMDTEFGLDMKKIIAGSGLPE